ncbi:hypothetical protein K4F52_005389 [Lecanicillium sp. MT-2017a]|nr:hypothetical protein K4F52_005389 [Lecanicillium sp. MT-2017a]
MQYVASYTDIPVPKVYAVHREKGGFIYIEMAYVRGASLDKAWDGLSHHQKDTVVADLKQHMSCLRKLKPPFEGLVSSALQNPGYDCRIGFRFWGPMKNHGEFHSLARGHLRMEDVGPYLGENVAAVHNGNYDTLFTHADLAPRNIMVRDGHVVAIIDWAYAGWYPEYWEFTKAHYTYFGEDWEECLRIILPTYEMELEAERILWERLPEPGTRTTLRRDGVVRRIPGSQPAQAWLAARAGRCLSDLWALALSHVEYNDL